MQSINRMPVVQQVVDSVKGYIQSDKVKEGDKLPTEREFCEQLEVGRSTLREAFRILQANGYVEMKPGKGAFVESKTGHSLNDAVDWLVEHEVELKDFIEVRAAIEILGVRLAIRQLTVADIRQLNQIHRDFLSAVDRNDSAQVMQLDERFHNAIVGISRNKLLISMNRQISLYFESFRNRTFQIRQNVQNAVGPHSAILNAIIRRDNESAEEQMRLHLEKVSQDLEASRNISEGMPEDNT